MIKKVEKKTLGTAYHPSLQSLFHLYKKNHPESAMRFQPIRTINDDILHPGYGHHFHPHKEIEIFTFILEGELTYTLKGKGGHCLRRGDMSYLTSGSGIEHSEFNWADVPLRMIQVWMKPREKKLTSNIQYATYQETRHVNQWFLIASAGGEGPIHIQQSIQIWMLKQESKKQTQFSLEQNEQAYLVQLEGESTVNGETLLTCDGLEVYGEKIRVVTETNALLMMIVMPAYERL